MADAASLSAEGADPVERALAFGEVPVFTRSALAAAFGSSAKGYCLLRVERAGARSEPQTSKPSSSQPSCPDQDVHLVGRKKSNIDLRPVLPELDNGAEDGAPGAADLAAHTAADPQAADPGDPGQHQLDSVYANQAVLDLYGMLAESDCTAVIDELLYRDPHLEALVTDVIRTLLTGEISQLSHTTPAFDAKTGVASWRLVTMRPCAYQDEQGQRWPAVLLCHQVRPLGAT